MATRRLPDLTPQQVVSLQDALLENADALLTSALAVFDLGHCALARSLAILGLEESGKAIALHSRRTQVVWAPEGELFRCESLDEVWASHTKKLETVYHFLMAEPYWFDVEPPDPDENEAVLGTVRRWKRHDDLKQRGFYVDLSRTGEPMKPLDVGSEESFREVVHRVHQIGWQLRLGEHIEGKRQFEEEEGTPAWDPDRPENDWLSAEAKAFLGPAFPAEPGLSLTNAAYRFTLPVADDNPFRNFGRPGYEAETRELMALADQLGVPLSDDDAQDTEAGPPAWVRDRSPRRRSRKGRIPRSETFGGRIDPSSPEGSEPPA